VLLQASCEMTLHASDRTPIIAMPRPRSGDGQWIVSESHVREPAVPATEYSDGFGNLCQRLVVPKGAFRMHVRATVETADEIAVTHSADATSVDELPADALQYLLPSR
jgi:hypothetical protein